MYEVPFKLEDLYINKIEDIMVMSKTVPGLHFYGDFLLHIETSKMEFLIKNNIKLRRPLVKKKKHSRRRINLDNFEFTDGTSGYMIRHCRFKKRIVKLEEQKDIQVDNFGPSYLDDGELDRLFGKCFLIFPTKRTMVNWKLSI